MDNGMESMLEPYLFETNGLLDSLDEMLVRDEKIGEFSSDDVNEIFRIMHTIKGSSAMMEFDSISTAAHRVEDLFFFIRDKGTGCLCAEDKRTLFDLMFRSEDFLRSEVAKVENGEPLSDDVSVFCDVVTAFLDKISQSAAADTAKAPAGAPAASLPLSMQDNLPDDKTATCFIHIYLEEGIGMENLRAFMIVNALHECDLSFRSYPADMDTNSDTARTIIEEGFYLAFDSDAECKKGEDLLATQGHIRSYEVLSAPSKEETPAPVAGTLQNTSVAASQSANGALTAASGSASSAPSNSASITATASNSAATKAAAAQTAGAPVKQSLLSVNLQKLDALMDLVGEIVITESMVTSSPVLKLLPQDAYDQFNKSARQLRKLTDDLQDISMSLRMVPISGVFQKMNRIVRDMKQKLGKDVRLTIIGEDTEVDKTIVDSIQDPIMHIVRNSMDHGIEEDVNERIAVGKDPQGEIILSASHSSSEVVITITDDGYGMDPEKLLDKAEAKGMLTKPRAAYSTKEALGLILLPGFSTNKEVTEYSGRGVGMDVVKKNVEQVGGTVSITSELGKGTTITLKIPLTLAIVDGMKVNVGDAIFTIPIANIRQSFKVTKDEIILDESGNEMIERMGTFYPIVRLSDFYEIPGMYDDDIEEGILIWVEANEKSCCLYADDLVGEQQVVVKPLPAYLGSFNLKNVGISGCTILGDGNISIILDVANVYTAAIESV